MSNYYVLVLEEGIKAFSVVGHGQECKFTFALKGQSEPFSKLEDGDKVIGYISNDVKRFEYLFEVKHSLDVNDSILVKLFEISQGPQIDTLSANVKKKVYDNEQMQSFIEINEKEYQEIIDNMLLVNKNSYDVTSAENNEIDESRRIPGGVNTLLYGVPGSGKSWTIEHEYCKPGTVVERLVFHPDYTNADFVGQILPVVDSVDKQVTYEFTSGPFTNILRDAYQSPETPYVLIIEEINRGNAPAIFGDIFQLLDRSFEEKKIDGITFPVGTSEYGITNENVAKKVYNNGGRKVRIPSNLSILGTMNTSDQNVFTLDTAFQRRWNMRLIENNFDNVRGTLANAEILDTGVTWQRFCETVNTIIIGNRAKMASAEDKRLGVYFVHEQDLKFDNRALPTGDFISTYDELNDLVRLEILGTLDDAKKNRLSELRDSMRHNRLFPEKVIKYLWDDAFKFNPEALFDTESMDCLEKVIKTFVNSKGENRFRILRQTVRDALYPSQT